MAGDRPLRMADRDPTANQILSELATSRAEFHQLLTAVAGDAWNRPSKNHGWTNGQVVFQIALGFFLIVPLVVLMRAFAALPRSASRAFARCLNATTPLFNRINAIGPHFGAKVFSARRIGATFDLVHRRILQKVEVMRAEDWSRGMHYPEKWEPRFSDFMTFEALFRYPTVHLRHHRTQLQL